MVSLKYLDDSGNEITKEQYDYLKRKTEVDSLKAQLDVNDVRVLRRIKTAQKVSAEQVSQALSVPLDQARRILETLTERGVLQKYPFTNGAKYIVSQVGEIVERVSP